jgi:hypothetical protein
MRCPTSLSILPQRSVLPGKRSEKNKRFVPAPPLQVLVPSSLSPPQSPHRWPWCEMRAEQTQSHDSVQKLASSVASLAPINEERRQWCMRAQVAATACLYCPWVFRPLRHSRSHHHSHQAKNGAAHQVFDACFQHSRFQCLQIRLVRLTNRTANH